MVARRIAACFAVVSLGTILCAGSGGRPVVGASQTTQAASDVDRSPLSVAVSPDRRYAASANHTADSVSLIDLQTGRLLAEHACGQGPVDVAWIDPDSLLVSLLHDDAVVLLSWRDQRLTTTARIAVGDQPRGIAISSQRPLRAFVALAGADEVAVLDLPARRVIERISVGGIPGTLALSPDGRWLVTCCSVPGQLYVHDAVTWELVSRRNIFDYGFNLGVPVIPPDSLSCIIPHPVNRAFPVNEDNIEKGWAIDNRLTRLPLPDGEYWEQKQLNLDIRGDAAGDPNAVAISPNAKWLAVTCGGSHELLVFRYRDIPWPAADPGDFLPPEVQDDPDLLRRVELGGRPVDVEFITGTTAVVANYLFNCLQIVDIAEAKLLKTISLGGPREPSLVRRGEAIFYDSDRSLHSWFSCHTCHTDGHTSGQTFDTLNDGSFDTEKLTPSLRGVTQTAPWTWHGWQTDLTAAMHKSLNSTMSTETAIADDDVTALLAFLAGLEHPVSPHRQPDGELTAAAERGRDLFENKAGCNTCHQGEDFTSTENYDVGLGDYRDFYSRFNPPSLRGVSDRRRFLHDGRADSLQDVLTRYHPPEKLAGEKLTEQELKDLIAYLNSL